MRRVLLGSMVVVFSMLPHLAGAGSKVIQVEPSSDSEQPPAATAAFQEYRGFKFDLSENSGRKDVEAIADMLKRQLDIVESAGLSPRVLQFLRTVPIVASEMACLDEGAGAACYGAVATNRDHSVRALTTWDSDKAQWSNPDPVDLAVDSGLGVIMLRPNMMSYAKDPVMLHEFLHVYHARLMPQGYDNRGILAFYAEAKSKNLYPKEAYVLKNNREFFAVTASIFLAGKDATHEPNTRAQLKEKQPDYYKYLVGVFGFDPESPAVSPVASAD
jgi:hypothetical protein